MIANNIRVMVVEVSPGVVRLGIEAPREVSVVRAELHEQVGEENRRALSRQEVPGALLGELRSREDAPGAESAGTAGGKKGRPERDKG